MDEDENNDDGDDDYDRDEYNYKSDYSDNDAHRNYNILLRWYIDSFRGRGNVYHGQLNNVLLCRGGVRVV